MNNQQNNQKFQVIIIGAGPAGIGAALKLHKQNVPYIILEARNRIGGRVFCKNIDGVNVDLGASWIHSYSERNPLRNHVKQLKVGQLRFTNRQVGRIFIDGQSGQQFDDNTLQIASYNRRYIQQLSGINAGKSDKDISIYQSISQYIQQNINKSPPKQKRCFQLLVNMLQKYQGSSIKQLSAHHYQFRVDSGSDYLPEGSYAQFLRKIVLHNNIKILYQKEVLNICYDDESATISCRDSSIFKCKKLISSIPLGVLKSGKIKFQPQLPQEHQNSIRRLGFGLMNKIFVAFEQNFWGSTSYISIGCSQRGKYSHTYNLSYNDKNILCCFLTDDFARKTQNLQEEVILEDYLNLLRRLFRRQNLKVKGYAVTKWGKQQFSLGSYSSFHVGSSPQDCYKLREPIKKTLWIVGEHCYAEHIGTAHGAFQTGQWAAQGILKLLKQINPVFKQPKKNIEEKIVQINTKNLMNY